MKHELNPEPFNRLVARFGYKAKMSKIDKLHEVIIGLNSDTKKCITVLLSDDCNGRPTYYVGVFFATTPKELSEQHDTSELPYVRQFHYWNDMSRSITTVLSTF